MKKIFLILTLSIIAFSCETEGRDNIVSTQAKVLGEWEVYKFEKQDLVQELVNGETECILIYSTPNTITRNNTCIISFKCIIVFKC